ncbi:hypothetical protein GRJ2_003488800 [Grus japonensis]|uniref:Uncharacterized protein n=1 Tax=Grus japonensis TaxID=30415 RepID=A0ABC9YJJ8_GRUJA
MPPTGDSPPQTSPTEGGGVIEQLWWAPGLQPGSSHHRNKQEELEICAHLQGYDLIGITETWWDGSYDWSVGMEGYRLFRKDRQGRRGGDVDLYVNDQLECMELHLGMDEEPTESLWVRIKVRAGTGDIVVGVYYRPPDQGD